MNGLITKIDFFSGLDDRILEEISGSCVVRQFAGNEIVVREGETGRGLYAISRGRVKIERDRNGVRTRVAELGYGQFFGEMSLLDDKPQWETVTGIQDGECVLLTRESFVKLMNKYPEIPIRVARALAERLRAADDRAAAQPDIGIKSQIRNKLVETFESFYTLKALSRFSIAVLGCPVEGLAANTVGQIRVGDVKALFFPAGERVEMRIAAAFPGSFTLDVFTPARAAPYRFGPVAIDPGDRVKMTLARGRVALRKGATGVPFR